MSDTLAPSQPPGNSPFFSPLVFGNPGDVTARPEDITAVISLLKEASDRVLCIPDLQHKRAAQILTSRSEIFERCDPLPLSTPDTLDHKYPRFKAIGRTHIWLLLPAGYCHIDCEPGNLEWSQGGLPYPKLNVYVQSPMDTNNGVDLEDLINGMNLSEQWGIENLNLEGYTDFEWANKQIKDLLEDGAKPCLYLLTPHPFLDGSCGRRLSTTNKDAWGGSIHPRYMQRDSVVTVLKTPGNAIGRVYDGHSNQKSLDVF